MTTRVGIVNLIGKAAKVGERPSPEELSLILIRDLQQYESIKSNIPGTNVSLLGGMAYELIESYINNQSGVDRNMLDYIRECYTEGAKILEGVRTSFGGDLARELQHNISLMSRTSDEELTETLELLKSKISVCVKS